MNPPRRRGEPYPVVGPSLVQLDGADDGVNAYAVLGDQSKLIDYGNVHDYTGARNPGTRGWGGHGAPPCQNTRYASLAFVICSAAATSGRRKLVSTESGWGSDPALPQGVTEAVQARYIARDVLLHFAAGFVRTYIYELLDTGTDTFRAFGLLHADGSPKPAYTELATLLGAVDGPKPRSHPDSVNLSVSGRTENVHRILLEQANHRFTLVLWVEGPVAVDDVEAAPLTRNVVLRLAAPTRVVRLCSFNDAGQCKWHPGEAGSVLPLTVTDNLTLVQLR